MRACVSWPSRSDEVGLRRTQGIALVLRFQSRHDLSGLDPIPELAVVFKHPARDAERERDLVLRFNSAGQGDRHAGFALVDRYGTNWTGCGSRRFIIGLARREKRRHCQ